MMGCEPRLTVVPPLRVAGLVVPPALKVVLALNVKAEMAETSNAPPAPIATFDEPLMEPLGPRARVPVLMVVLPV